jgi:diguanylate cyclase (GGDEF)-like protein
MTAHYLLIGLAIIVVIGVPLFFIARSSGLFGKERTSDSTYPMEITEKDRQIKNLNLKTNKLVELNSRYLFFMFQIPSIIQRLNATLKLQEIVAAIIELVNNIILTKKVEIYLFDPSHNRLSKLYVNDTPEQDKVYFALGEDLVGAAAEHRFIMTREHYNRISPQSNGNSKSQLRMAVPIIFKDRLLGVIGIGEIENPVGNEGDLLKMIADIAGVALFNQIIFNDAQHQANTDALTGLNNRNYFFQMSQHYVERSLREGIVLSVFLFDIDNFKNYNDTNGHNAGDKLLIELGKLLRSASRKSSVVARYGGEEFIVMLPGISKEDAFIYAERLREQISQYPFENKEKQPLGFVSVSGGIAAFPEDGDSLNKVIQNADISLYQAKAEGKNRVLVHKAKLSDNTIV